MNQQDQSKPYLVGGLVMGILSVIPLISAGNTCCCLWAWVGGAIAAKLLVDKKTSLLTKFISKAGRPFPAYLVMDDAGKITFDFPPREITAEKGQ